MVILFHTDEGSVSRTNVADVVIYTNESKFIFKGNMTTESLWPGMGLSVYNYRLVIQLAY